jgi:hypothetical protein
MKDFNINDLNTFFLLDNGLYSLADYSYQNISDFIFSNYSSQSLLRILYLTKKKTIDNDKRVFIVLMSIIQDSKFSKIDILNFFENLGDDAILFFTAFFNEYKDAYLFFPLSKFVDNHSYFLQISNTLIKTNTNTAKFICDQGLNKLSLTGSRYSVSDQNKILDLKLSCCIYK